jgi:hypothetical protein
MNSVRHRRSTSSGVAAFVRPAVRRLFGIAFFLLLTTVCDASIYEKASRVKLSGPLDELLKSGWDRQKLPVNLEASDAVFVRRAHLDFLGRLPTVAEAKAYIGDNDPDKKRKLIDRLLADDDGFADYWAMRFGDILRVKSEFPVNLWPNAVFAYHRFIYDALRRNLPLDRFACELLLSAGSNFRNPGVNFFRATANRDAAGIAKVAALTFMGVRFDKLPEAERKNLIEFFSRVRFKPTGEWKEEIVFAEPAAETANLVLPDGKKIKVPPGADRRKFFCDYLLNRDNPVFARSMVNRVWHWFFGGGIVEEADDLRPDNPPCNPELLEYLTGEFVKSGYDLRALCRLIGNSAAYCASSEYAGGDLELGRRYFAVYPIRRLDAEVIDDAIGDITMIRSSYSSVIPEPFTFMPKTGRTITLPDGSINSQFLILFGRPARDFGVLSERNNEVTVKQRLFLLNSGDVYRRLGNLYKHDGFTKMPPRQKADFLYYLFLSRPATAEEFRVADEALKVCDNSKERWRFWQDLAWVLLNTKEFIFQH